MVYDTRMRGLYSLKVIQGILDSEISYHDLAVENGLDAVITYRKLLGCDDEVRKKEYYDELYQYCGLDSSAMIKVYQWLTSLS